MTRLAQLIHSRLLRFQLLIVVSIVAVTSTALVLMDAFKPETPVEKMRERIENVEAISATRQSVFPTVHTQAVVESKLNIILKSQVNGQIVFISPSFLSGGFFDTGELILKVDSSDYELALVQAEVNVARAQQELSTERELSDLARLDWEKYSTGTGEATDLVLRIPQLRGAESALKGARANYDTEQLRLSRTEIRAPFPLMIESKQVDLGQIITANQDLAAVFGTEEAEIRMPLSQKQIDLLQILTVGILQPENRLAVTVRDPTRESKIIWEAEILRLESSIDRKSRVYYAVATVFDPMNLKGKRQTPPLLPGVFVDLEVQGPETTGVYKVPVKAMRTDTDIYIYENEQLITKKVKVLDRNDAFVTIISGIDDGDKICISPPWSYVPGMKATLASLDGVPMNGRPGMRKPNNHSQQTAARTAPSMTKPEAPDTSSQRQSGYTEEQRHQRRKDIANMSPEQKKALREKMRARKDAMQQIKPAVKPLAANEASINTSQSGGSKL